MTSTVSAPAVPSVHLRAVVTWCAIFPMVTIGMFAMAPFTAAWHPVLRTLVLTAFVVPAAVYVVVPRLLAGVQRIARHRPANPVCGERIS
ncbi:hypothetical protein NONO_c07640 [Nocardia nova SH22a]|uniref:Uncharacterized protein n=1 Tax=Nocardia nova SH22a TaxID=1415166 RepID=W5T8N9_9NOCA|nr:hypothetical protein [Nocardia nova]AHH15572.1 hypothetical protein NONO_c07640 [Nocardia nova SH22a]